MAAARLTRGLTRLFFVVGLVCEMGMAHLFAQFAVYDLPVFNRGYQVKGGTSKVLADCLAIIGNCCNFHSNISSLFWF